MGSSVAEQVEQDGAPAEEAEATRSTTHLFQYSKYVHAGAGAQECPDRESGKCQDHDHFHAWLCIPNTLQNRDIQEKARAAKARRKRALRDAGGDGRQPSDAYVTLESELDDLMAGDRQQLLSEIADRNVRKQLGEIVIDVREEERFEHYEQDSEEFRRLSAMDGADRDEAVFKQLDERMTEFGKAIEERVKGETEREIISLRSLDDGKLRDIVRDARIEGEANEQSEHVYHTWLAFIGTRVCASNGSQAKRYFPTLEDFRNASPEAVDAIDDAMRDLTMRTIRGEPMGN